MRDATKPERYKGNQLSQVLRETTEPFILRRTKAEVLEDKHNSFNDSDKVCICFYFLLSDFNCHMVEKRGASARAFLSRTKYACWKGGKIFLEFMHLFNYLLHYT